jgi:DNA end-binding protein Ku
VRAIWKGAVSFGLVNVPVRLFAATQEHDIRFHQVHRADGGRIRMKRTCSVCGEEVSYDQLAKGYESEDGRLVVLTDEDFESLPLATGHEIDVVEFVPTEQVDPILFARSYYLEPDAKALKPYALLREALEATERMAVVKVALRQRESLAVLRVRDRVIMLQTLLWPDEVRAADFDVLETDVSLRPQELRMASSLVESMAADFEPDQYEDDYQKALGDLVEAKLAGAAPAPMEAAEATDSRDVVDLLSALQASVDRAKTARGGDSSSSSDDEGSGDAAAAGNGAGSKPAAKQASSRKSTATKEPARKTAAAKSSAKSTTSKTASKSAAKAPVKKSTAKKATTTRTRRSA